MTVKPKKQAKDKPPVNKKRKSSNKGKPRVITPAVKANPGGRPSEFDEASPKIINYIRGGNTYECSAACARVSYTSFNRWMKQGEEDDQNGFLDSKFRQFWKDVQQAEMEAEQECVQAWRSFIPVNWQAAKDFLSRRNPEKWGSKEKVDVTSKGDKIEGAPFWMPLKDEDDE